jgi:inorganic pyrophosphatase
LKDIESDYVRLLVCALPLLILGMCSLVFVGILRVGLSKKKIGADIGVPKLDYLAQKVKSGSIAFLKEEYKYLAVYVVVWAIVCLVLFSIEPIVKDEKTDGVRSAACLIIGAVMSGASGYIGMTVATDGNVRTTVACASGSLNDGLKVAFRAGAAMGFGVVGLAAVGLSFLLILMKPYRTQLQTIQYTHSFGFGASSIALFARVAGGIYTKAADVGADLVGKVEAGIDEDDPHNPAVIADNVGDNVGDVAGMGADLFESYIGSIIGCATLGGDVPELLALPMWLAAAGLLSSFIGFFFVSTKEEGDGWNTNLTALMFALEKGMYIANVLFLIFAAVIVILLFGADSETGWRHFTCVFLGLVSGMAIGKGTEFFTSFDYGPTISIKDRARTGPATVIIQGMGVGMVSTILPTLILVGCIVACNALSGQYGISLAAVGMLGTLAVSLSTDAYGPVADNAGGLAEMAGLGPEVRAKTDSLDALGNTTAAMGKGFAVGSAVLTALSLLAAFKHEVSHEKALTFEIFDPILLGGMLLGAMLPFFFAALTMMSVGKAAAEMIQEVRTQFRTIKNAKGVTLLEAIQKVTAEGKISEEDDVEPDSDRCVKISTQSSVKEMIAPGLYAVFTPLIAGFLVGPRMLMGLLAGCIGSAAMMAIMMGNAGGAWDNSKKLCEKLKLKKTDQGKACVVGDTVGDPFKDTSGPSLDILLKLMAMVSLLMAPLIDGNDDWKLWYVGLIITVLCLGATLVLMWLKILTWQDPLAKLDDEQQKTTPKPATPDKSGDRMMSPVLPVDPAAPAQAWGEPAAGAPAAGAPADVE